MTSTPDELPTAAASDDALRGLAGVLGAGLLCALIACVPMIDAVRAELRVGPIDVAVALGGFWLVMVAGAIVYRVAGPSSKAYQLFDPIESTATQLAVLSLVVRSGQGDSFFWLLSIVHSMILGRYGRLVRFNLTMLSTLPALVALAFTLQGDAGAGALSLVIGGIGVYVYWFALGVSRRLIATEAELAETRVRQERERIARDIHDGIGADLAALDWRLRGLRASQPAIAAEIDELVGRLGQGSADLRTIVWALRTPSRSWMEIVAYLRQRAAELCGDSIELEVVDEGDGGVSERAGEVAVDYMRAVLEMVRNAVRHANARHLRVVLQSGATGLAASVEDDGKGLAADAFETSEGGLANLQQRVSRAGGELAAISRPQGGTSLRVRLPVSSSST